MYELSKKSRRELLKRMGLGGVTIGVSHSVLTAGDGENTIIPPARPLHVEMLSQPDRKITTLASYSSLSKRVATAAGILTNVGLYVSSRENRDVFKAIWSSTADISQIHAVQWSPDDNFIAFVTDTRDIYATSKSKTVSLCVADVFSETVRELIILEEIIGVKKVVCTTVDWKRGLAWLNKNTICVCSHDNAVLTVDLSSGEIDTLIPSQSGAKIASLAITTSGQLRFLKKSLINISNYGYEHRKQGIEAFVCEFETGKVVNLGKATSGTDWVIDSNLSPDGNYVFLHTVGDSGATISTQDASSNRVINEIPEFADDGLYFHYYIPITIPAKNELVLLHASVLSDKGETYFEDIQNNVEEDGMPFNINISREPCFKLAKFAI